MPGESQEAPSSPPDPSVMATEAVTRALAAMRDYVDGEVEAINQRIEGLDRLLGCRFDDLRSLLDERYTTQTKGLEVAFAAAEKAVSAALESAEKAVTKAELAADKRFESVNEFRAQLADQAATLMARAEAEIRFASLGEKVETMAGGNAQRISELEKRANVGSGETAGMAGVNVTRRADVVMVAAVVGVLVAIGSLVAVILIATGK